MEFTKDELKWIIKQAKDKQKTAVGLPLLTKVFEIERKAVKKMNYMQSSLQLKEKEKLSYGEWLKVNGYVKFSNLLYKKDNKEWLLFKVVNEYNAYTLNL